MDRVVVVLVILTASLIPALLHGLDWPVVLVGFGLVAGSLGGFVVGWLTNDAVQDRKLKIDGWRIKWTWGKRGQRQREETGTDSGD